jgi:hypothetical protein
MSTVLQRRSFLAGCYSFDRRHGSPIRRTSLVDSMREPERFAFTFAAEFSLWNI